MIVVASGRQVFRRPEIHSSSTGNRYSHRGSETAVVAAPYKDFRGSPRGTPAVKFNAHRDYETCPVPRGFSPQNCGAAQHEQQCRGPQDCRGSFSCQSIISFLIPRLRQNPRMRFCRRRHPVLQHRWCRLKILHRQVFQTSSSPALSDQGRALSRTPKSTALSSARAPKHVDRAMICAS